MEDWEVVGTIKNVGCGGCYANLGTYLEWYREIMYNYCTEVEDTSEHTGK